MQVAQNRQLAAWTKPGKGESDGEGTATGDRNILSQLHLAASADAVAPRFPILLPRGRRRNMFRAISQNRFPTPTAMAYPLPRSLRQAWAALFDNLEMTKPPPHAPGIEGERLSAKSKGHTRRAVAGSKVPET
ncbi:hypothetical protein C8024_01135 [Sphingopyxis sp. BSNA05]|nr:hypothetical protein [Sphingopyxis sp. BSNA05]